MGEHSRRLFIQRPLLLAALASATGLALALPGYAQVSPEEHEAHHPAQGKGSSQPTGEAGGMGGMMEEMGKAPPKALYPSLMGLPELSPEQREEVLSQARARMKEGSELLSKSLDEMTRTAEAGDYLATQEAAGRAREGLSRFESGVAARRALAEGKPPREVALQWFKREMSLSPVVAEPDRRVLGLSWLHFVVMAALLAFAAAMIWMYFHKMRRATRLLQALTGTSEPVAAASPPTQAASPVVPVEALPLIAPTGAPLASKRWSGKLRVGQIFQETPDVKTFRLLNPLGGVLPFTYLPGQFLTVTVIVGGKPIKRSYTIASSPTQRDYAELTVKHATGGEVSGFLHDQVRQGDLLELSGPSGSFTFTGRECKCILLIGGGVGITPLMSVLRYLTDRSWPGDIFLLYACKTPGDIIFREDLEYLQRRHSNLRVVFTVSHPEGTDWKGPTGRITKELITQSVPDLASRYIHICGPVPMMEATKRILAELGVPAERIKTEAFGPALGKPEPTLPGLAVGDRAAQAALPAVTFSRSKKSAPLPPDKAILEVADESGVDIDNSCRVGTCGTCRVRLLSGKVSMAVEEGLEPGDKENNIILACQAKSTGDVTVEA